MPAQHWQLASRNLDITRGALIGVVNVTPDSFSQGGTHYDPDLAVAHALQLVADGAAVIDVGGESTRPGAHPVAAKEELRRVMPAVSDLAAEGVIVSIDTSKPSVAEAALAAGAQVVNDVTGFRSEAMLDIAEDSGCGVVAMHMQGTPKTMSEDPSYKDVVSEVEEFLLAGARRLEARGVDRSRIALDPGFGFGKRRHHSLALLGSVERLADHGYPLMIGTSRKGFLGEYSDTDFPEDRDVATAVTTALAYAQGARLFRVHNIALSRHVLALANDISTQ